MSRKIKENQGAYTDEILLACKNGKPCSYGICDECPNVLNNRSDEDEEEE